MSCGLPEAISVEGKRSEPHHLNSNLSRAGDVNPRSYSLEFYQLCPFKTELRSLAAITAAQSFPSFGFNDENRILFCGASKQESVIRVTE